MCVCIYVCLCVPCIALYTFSYHQISGNIQDQSITIGESGEQLLAWVPHLIDGSYRIRSIGERLLQYQKYAVECIELSPGGIHGGIHFSFSLTYEK